MTMVSKNKEAVKQFVKGMTMSSKTIEVVKQRG